MLAGLVCSLLVARLLAEVWLPLAASSVWPRCWGRRDWAGSPSAASGATATRLHAQQPIGDGRPQALISVVVTLTAVGALVFALLA